MFDFVYFVKHCFQVCYFNFIFLLIFGMFYLITAFTLCLVQGKGEGLIVEGEKARKSRSFHRLESLSERKERQIFMGPTAKNLSAQVWKESKNW
jgi:hypothetical protein